MKNSLIINNTRKSLRRQLFFPMLLFVCFTVVLVFTPRDNFSAPRPLNYKSSFENFYNRELPYVTITVPSLKYSGLNYVVDGRIQGHYYYTLNDGICQFYVLAHRGTAPPSKELTGKTVHGRLIQMDGVEYESIIKNMAAVLNLTPDSLRNLSAPYAVTTIPYPIYLVLLFYAVLLTGLITATADIICLLFYMKEPLRSPTFRHLGSLRERFACLSTLELELRLNGAVLSESRYLTSDCFLGPSDHGYIVLPLSDIVQVYYKSKRHYTERSPLINSYTLCVTVKKGRTYRFSGIRYKELEQLLSDFRDNKSTFVHCAEAVNHK